MIFTVMIKPGGAGSDFLHFMRDRPLALLGVLAHRLELQGKRLLIVCGDARIQTDFHPPSLPENRGGQKPP